MSDRVLVASFEHEDDLLAATRAVRGRGLHIVDAFTPYAVHGLDKAMGLRSSRLTWVCFICGMIGAVEALASAAGPVAGRQFGPYGQSSGSGNVTVCVTPANA